MAVKFDKKMAEKFGQKMVEQFGKNWLINLREKQLKILAKNA